MSAPERGLGEADRHLADQVVAVPLEERVLADEDLDPQVAPRGARVARLPLAAELEPHPALDARRHVDLQVGDLRGPARPPAGRARVGHPDPLAAAGRAGGRDLEEPARLDDLPLAAAVVAGRRDGPLLGARCPLQSAQYSCRVTSIDLVVPRGGLDEVDLELVEQVLARPRAPPALAEEVAEEAAAEDVAEGRHDVLGVAEVVDPRAFDPGVAVAVVPLALRLVGEDLVRLGPFLEPLLGLGVARVLVGVVLQGQLPIGFLDLFGGGVAFDPKDFVIITFRRCHRHGVSNRDKVQATSRPCP